MENEWQFCKLYPKVYKIKQFIHKNNPDFRWQHETEVLAIDGKPTDKYWAWREKGFANKYWVRYPNGFQHKKECIGSVIGSADHYEIVGYIEARKRIYFPKYKEAAEKTQSFKDLLARYTKGEKLQIVEVDGPTYTNEYPFSAVKNGSIGITKEILKSLVNNPTQNFGHGYCICACLMDIDVSDF
jgi:hypothetical protein